MANTDLNEIDRVLLLGSMLQMKALQKVVTQVIPHDVDVTWLEKTDVARGAAIHANRISSFSQRNRLSPKAVSCTANDVALLAESPDSVQMRPKVLIEKGKPIPASHSRTLRPKVVDGQSSSLPKLQLIESSSIGNSSWLKLGRIDPMNAFPDRSPEEAMQLRLELDASGILESSLVLTNSNQSVPLPASSDPELAASDIEQWRDWLHKVQQF